MTVYELIKALTEYPADTEVVVGVGGAIKEFKIYMEEYEGSEKMDIGAKPIEVDYPYYKAEKVEIFCDIDPL